MDNNQNSSMMDDNDPTRAEDGPESRPRRGWNVRLGLGGKLIGAMMLVSILGVLAMGITSRIGFDRGFIDYLNDGGIARIEALQPVVAARYEEHGSWDFLLESPRIWFELVGIPGNQKDVPPIGTPIPVHEPVDVSGTSLRISLLDGQRNFIIGYLEDRSGSVERPIVVHGETVGWLTFKPAVDVITGADRRFKQKQDRMTLVIGLVAVVLAAGLAILLSGRIINLLRPIRRAVGQLAAGNYRLYLEKPSDDEIGDLTMDVNHLAMVLERTESARLNLMEDLSHELRTPIAILQAELEAIQDGVQTWSKDTVRSLLTEVKTLSVLVEDVCEVSSSDVGALSYRYETVDVVDILDCTVHAFEERRRQTGITFDYVPCEGGVLVNGDFGRLNQLFNNLIENSIRYTYSGGTLRIRTTLDQDAVELVFEDSAPGVPEQVLDNLFERSFKGRQRIDIGGKGNGLGLAIVKNIIEAHRGSIDVENSTLGGLKVVVRLPMIMS